MDDASDMDAVGNRLIENYVGPNDERAKVVAEILSTLPKFGLVGERLQSVKQLSSTLLAAVGLC